MTEFAALTDPGARGGENQDAVGWDLERGLWFVADGMGGHERGQDASRIVKETLLGEPATTDLNAAVLKAHQAVHAAALAGGVEHGMGSTVVCAQISNGTCHIVWVGDSRAYLWRRRALSRLTRDDSYAEEMLESGAFSETEVRRHPNASVVLQTLGMGTPVPSENDVRLRNGDWVILCSDGLPLELRDPEIAHILKGARTPGQAAQQLLAGALARGGRDNTSVVVVQYGPPPASGVLGLFAGLDTGVVGVIAAVAGVLLAAGVAIIAWRLRAGR